MKIYLGTDHAGFELKNSIKEHLLREGYDVKDFGAHGFDPADDYPDFVNKVAEAVSLDSESKGIVLGYSGQGEAIASNRYKNVRAVVYYGGDGDIIKLSREHNNANILSLGAHFLNIDEAKAAVDLWLETEFPGDERHVRRLNKF